MTLKELYEIELAKPKLPKPPTPAAAFIAKIAEVTRKSEVAVRRWLGNENYGAYPDELTQEVLAKYLGTTPEELFPKKQ